MKKKAMSKDGFRFDYDPLAALANCPKLLGMELRECGPYRLQGPYYLNGDIHAFRRDKLKVFVSRGSVWLAEEGGEVMSLTSWLVRYGGCANYREAVRAINGQPQVTDWVRGFRAEAERERLHVSPDVLMAAKAYDLRLSPLFRYMCELFPESRVREVWDTYNVTANGKGGTVFWYLNQKGQICHDKICWYGEDGHRVKTLPMGRQYRIGDGYTESPLFGSHLDGEVKGILESEKSCLYAACYYGGVWLATGGKNALRDVGSIPLYPDRDAEELWSRHGDCVNWYSDWPECGDHSDLGDKIEWLVRSGWK